MTEELNKELFDHYIYTVKAPHFDKHKRAELIKAYIEENNISNREFSRKFDVPIGTLQDWLLWAKVTPFQVEQLKDLGMTSHMIQRSLRVERSVINKEIKVLDARIDTLAHDLFSPSIYKEASEKTMERLDELIKAINRAKLTLERNLIKAVVFNK